ncbi:MAG: VCBS repeat-containing protein [Bacteroidia bacterium]
MKSKFLFPFLVFTQVLSAQTFTEVPQSPPFQEVFFSSIAFADVDGDGDLDVLITGRSSLFGGENQYSKLYTNDGVGNFTEMQGTPFESVGYSSIAFADVDGDGDQDVLITGRNSAYTPIAKLYTNDGVGNFSEMTGTPFDGVDTGSIAFADVDGDNDQDLLITGRTHSLALIAKLYTNDGQGSFTEMVGAPFLGVEAGSVAFTDVDGDNDQDLLITGRYSLGGGTETSKLYTNDGQGNFTENVGTQIADVENSSIAFADVDGDNDQDLLITGRYQSIYRITKMYTNDGVGNFSEMIGTPFDSVEFGSITFGDVDGDNDQDVSLQDEHSAQMVESRSCTPMTESEFQRNDWNSF